MHIGNYYNISVTDIIKENMSKGNLLIEADTNVSIRKFMVPIMVSGHKLWVSPLHMMDVCKDFWTMMFLPESHGFEVTDTITYELDSDETYDGVYSALWLCHVPDPSMETWKVSPSCMITLLKWMYPYDNLSINPDCLNEDPKALCRLIVHPYVHKVLYCRDTFNDYLLQYLTMDIFRGVNKRVILHRDLRYILDKLIEGTLDPLCQRYLLEYVQDKELRSYIESVNIDDRSICIYIPYPFDMVNRYRKHYRVNNGRLIVDGK